MTTLCGCQSPSVTEPQREGGARQGFPEANEMSFGGSLRSVTEGECATLSLYKRYRNAGSSTRLRRERDVLLAKLAPLAA